MKTYLRLASELFNRPLLAAPDLADLAVNWANRHLNLNIVNVSMGAEAKLMDEGDYDRSAIMEQREESRRVSIEQTGVQVIPVYGVLVSRNGNLNACETMTSYEQIRSQLQEALNNPAVEHIVFDIDSPGGSAVGAFELADEIFAARSIKPSTALVNFSAYSGGYLLAAAAGEIVIPRTGGVGSVGVIAKHLDISGELAQLGRKVTTVFAGAHKNDLTPTEPISDQSLAVLQEIVQDAHLMFLDSVARYRGMSVEAVRATEARLYRGEKAGAVGFADRIQSAHVELGNITSLVASKRQERQPQRRIAMQAAAMAMQMQS